ncbi:MAG: lysophospholipase [Spirochaetae bacterium HGW-Spirochaetae-1]|jgi:alpha-beta hydrolase superfamily lysophospholipase|nr:MAG: lysophospholipase [Spirochaetae bacterium HGW-Spirochaetae-1]
MDSYTHNSGTFIGKGGNEIFFQSWTVPSPKAVLVISHGIGEHSGRYQNIIGAMAKEKISIYGLDHRGHGRSGGNRGHVDSFMDFVYDLKLFVNYIREQNIGLPLIMLGHSMGGTIACRFAIEYGDDLAGLILSSPAVLLKVKIPAWKETMGTFFSTVLPGLTLSTALDSGNLSHDRNVIEAYENDPLVHDKASARFFTEFTKTREACLNRSFELTMPLLVFHGKEDGLVDYQGSELVYEKASSSGKELHIYKGLYHETMNETEEEKNKVLAMVKKWILKIAGSGKGVKKTAAAAKAPAKKSPAKKAVKKVQAKKTVKKAVKKAPAKKIVKKSNKKVSAEKAVKKAPAKKIKNATVKKKK